MTRPLLEKLGYKAGMDAMLLDVPDPLADRFEGIANTSVSPRWILAFARDSAGIARIGDEVLPLYRRGGHLWIAYPKLTGALRADISRDRGWEPVSRFGLLGVTQVALDADWSALRFRFRDEIARLTRKSS